MSEKDTPVRIVKKKGGHGGHHGGAWKVAYADFVTAMMALFIVLWIVGQSKSIKNNIAAYFKDPGVFETTKGSIGAGEEGGKPKAGVKVPADKDALKKTLLEAQKAKMQSAAAAIQRDLAKSPTLSTLAGQVKIQIVDEGLRLELVETSNSFFFDVGTSKLQPEKEKIIGVIAEEVKGLPNKIIIEGHTDSRPYSNLEGYTNFELSADRANAARRVMIRNGVNFEQIEGIRGYDDTHLRNPEDPYDASNRRISILIKYDDKALK
jgi:chemotaxis protein MotB